MENYNMEAGAENNSQLNNQYHTPANSIPVIAEEAHVSKQVVESGKVHVSKKVTHQDFDADIPVLSEEVVVEKKAINRYVEGDAPGIRMEGNTTIIPVLKEVIVKRILLVEEIHITKRNVEGTVSTHETLRKEEVTITRDNNSTQG